MLANNFSFLSNAGTLSSDTRYETFTDNYISVKDVLEEDKVDVEIGGNTLINAVGSVGKPNYGTSNSDNNSFSFTGESRLFRLYFNNTSIKTNTKYTVFYDITKNTLKPTSSTSRVLKFTLNNYNTAHFPINKNDLGPQKQVITTSSEVTSTPYIETMESVTGEFAMRDIMVIEGDYSDYDFEFFKGLLSVGENNNTITVKSHNKNMFDYKIYDGIFVNNGDCTLVEDGIKITTTGKTTDLVDGYIDTGISSSHTYIKANSKKYLMPVEENIKYSLSYKVTPESVHDHDVFIEFRDKDYKSLGYRRIVANSSLTSNSVTFDSPTNAKYIHMRFDNNLGGNSLIFSQIQLEEAEKPTSYEKYKSDEKTFILNEPLKSLPNGVKDKIVKTNGLWYIERNIGETVLDGSEGWNSMAIDYYQNKNIGFISFEKPGVCASKEEEVTVQSDLFAGLKYRDTYSDRTPGVEGISVGGQNRIYVFIDMNRLETWDAAGFRKWLSVNNVKVVYELEESIYEPLNISSNFNLFKETSYISNNSSIPLNMKITVDRVANRAKEFSEIAKLNPTIDNIS